MTNGDKIRSMSDEMLAIMLTVICTELEKETLRKLAEQGIEAAICSPAKEIQMLHHLKWLQSESKA